MFSGVHGRPVHFVAVGIDKHPEPGLLSAVSMDGSWQQGGVQAGAGGGHRQEIEGATNSYQTAEGLLETRYHIDIITEALAGSSGL